MEASCNMRWLGLDWGRYGAAASRSAFTGWQNPSRLTKLLLTGRNKAFLCLPTSCPATPGLLLLLSRSDVAHLPI